MTEAVAPGVATPPRLSAADPRSAQARMLRKRHAAERRFMWYGRIAILIALSFLVILLARVIQQGHTALWTHSVEVPVTLPSGLLCRDLSARGVSYPDAVSYWWNEGAPDRMDADLNGIPCETVYPSDVVYNYW